MQILKSRLESTCVTLMVFRENHLGGEPIKRIEVEVRMGKIRNGKAAGKDEVTGEMVKSESEMVVRW